MYITIYIIYIFYICIMLLCFVDYVMMCFPLK